MNEAIEHQSGEAADQRAVIDALRTAERCVVTSHVNPEGDSLGSQLVLAAILRELGKEVAIVDEDVPPERYRFMPGIEAVVRPDAVSGAAFDTAFVLDCGSLERVGTVRRLLDGARVVNIDHHRSNTRFGDINHVVPDACAAGLLVYELNEELGLPLTLDKATNLYAAIIADTGNFQYANTSSRVLTVAAQLVEAGADPARLSLRVFGCRPLPALKLLCEALGTLSIEAAGRIGVIELDRAAFERAGATDADAEGVVNFAKRVQGTDVGLLLREREDGTVQVSLRSDGAVDVDSVARRFGGGGHHNAAGARVEGPLAEARQRLLAAFADVLPARRP